MKTIVCLCLLGLPSCIYPASAERAYGVANTPGIKVWRNWLGTGAEVSNNTNGDIEAKYNAETKSFEIQCKLFTNASDVYDAQGRRFTETMRQSRDNEVDAMREIGVQTIGAIKDGIAMLGVVAPQAIPAYLQAMNNYADVLKGSSVSLPIPGVGTASVNIGQAVRDGATVTQGAVTTEIKPAEATKSDNGP